MSSDIDFEGGHIFNHDEYPSQVMAQSIPMIKKMGANVDIRYATVDVNGAEKDLESIGYNLRWSSSIDTLDNINPSLIDERIAGLVKDYFEEDIRIKHGDDIILTLIQYTIDNQVASYENNFFSSSSKSEGTYYSYQLTFYSMRKASFCFLVLSLISFKDQESIFGIPTKFKTGVSYSAQIFEVQKVYNNVLFNYGILRGGGALGSPNGQHKASLSTDGNLSVDDQWQSGTGGKGDSPHYLAMQEDANLVIYDKNDNPTWASNSAPGRFSEAPYRVEMQDDGNLVVNDKHNTALWSFRW